MSDRDATQLSQFDHIRRVFLENLELEGLSTGCGDKVEQLLGAVSEVERGLLFRVLITAELNFRIRKGLPLQLAEFLRRFPQYTDIIDEVSRCDLDSAVDTSAATADQRHSSNATAKVVGPSVAPGQSVGRYRLESIVGTGAFGEVWSALDPQLGRKVAIKLPRSDRLFTAQHLSSFLDEARRVAQLHITGIVAVHDVGQEGAAPFIVSDLVDGETLADCVKQKPLSWQESARIVADVAEILHRAHLKDVVHRDVKPNNIMLDRSGQVFVTDFGLAANEMDQLKESEGILGTFAYMSPEQARGESNRVDARTDIYSLGVILYQLLTKRLPFVATSASDSVKQILHREARPPRTIDDTIPMELERICLKCLAKQPADRYSTARDLATDLKAWGNPRKAASYAHLHPLFLGIAVILVAVSSAMLIMTVGMGVGVPRQQVANGTGDAIGQKADDGVVAKPANQNPRIVEPQLAIAPIEPKFPSNTLEDVWQKQMGQLPQELIWPGYKGGGKIGFRVDLQAYEVISQPQRFIQLGTLDDRPSRIGITIEQPVWTGYVGVFLGYREVEYEGGRGLQMQLIQGNRQNGADGRPVYALSRQIVEFSPMNERSSSLKSLGFMEVRSPAESRSVRLELEIRGNKIVSGSWGGIPLTFLNDGQNRRTTTADYIGPWGVYSEMATTWFRYPSFQNP